MRVDGNTPRPLALRRVLTAAADHLNRGSVAEAELLYREALDADPGNAEAAAALGELPVPGSPRPLHRRLGRRYARPAIEALAQRPRVWKYRVLSTCPGLFGTP